MRRILIAAASVAALTAGAFAQDAAVDQNPAAAGRGAPNTQGTTGNENQAESVPATGMTPSTGTTAETMNNGGAGVDQNSPTMSNNGAPNAQGTTGNEDQAEAAPATGSETTSSVGDADEPAEGNYSDNVTKKDTQK